MKKFFISLVVGVAIFPVGVGFAAPKYKASSEADNNPIQARKLLEKEMVHEIAAVVVQGDWSKNYQLAYVRGAQQTEGPQDFLSQMLGLAARELPPSIPFKQVSGMDSMATGKSVSWEEYVRGYNSLVPRLLKISLKDAGFNLKDGQVLTPEMIDQMPSVIIESSKDNPDGTTSKRLKQIVFFRPLMSQVNHF